MMHGALIQDGENYADIRDPLECDFNLQSGFFCLNQTLPSITCTFFTSFFSTIKSNSRANASRRMANARI